MDYIGSTHVDASADALFDFLADVRNVPRYRTRMTSVRPAEGEQVHMTARLADGREVEGTAWFRVSMTERALDWGSGGRSGYSGHLEVRPSGEGAEVEVRLHTDRDDDPAVRRGIEETLADLRRLAESGVMAQ